MAITNATPRHISLGTDDQSMRMLKPAPATQAQHVPLFFLNTPRGDYKRHVVTGGELMALFGDEVLDPVSKYSNHATIFASHVLGTGSQAVVQRLKTLTTATDSAGANPKNVESGIGNIAVWLMTEKDPIPAKKYVRDAATGKIVRDASGAPTFTAVDIPVRHSTVVYSYRESPQEVYHRWDGTAPAPDDAKLNQDFKTDFIKKEVVIDGVTYELVPLYTVAAEGHGASYNNYGVTLLPLIGDATDVALKEKAQSIKYEFRVFDKHTGRRLKVKTKFGDDAVNFSFKRFAVDPITNQGIMFEDLFPSSYGNYVDPDLPLQPYIFADPIMGNRADFDATLKKMLALEIEADSNDGDGVKNFWADYSEAITEAGAATDEEKARARKILEDEFNLVNFVTLKATSEVEYEALRPFVPTAQALLDLRTHGIELAVSNMNAPGYLKSGEDGDFGNLANYETSVVAEMEKYMDSDSQVIPVALNQDTIIYDTGFTFATKKKLAKYIGIRRDNFVILSTYTWNEGNAVDTLADTLAKGSSLKAILKLYPESKTFGTPVARAAIVMGSGITSDGIYRYRVPLSLDYAVKMAKFMGAGNGRWKPPYAFSKQPNNLVTEVIDIEPKFIPPSIKTKLWKAGLMWVDNEDTVTYFYPGQQTVYENDTSVLNTVPTAVAIGTIARVNDAAWRKFSGVNDMNETELKIAVEEYVASSLKDRFASMYTIRPEVVFTEADKLRGYSWHLIVRLYADVMKTVMESHIVALRSSDLEKK